MKSPLRALVGTCVLACALVAWPARADVSPEKKMRAESLFRDGRALLAAGKVAENVLAACTRGIGSTHETVRNLVFPV